MPLDGLMLPLPGRPGPFTLEAQSTRTGTGDGELLSASRGDTLWGGKVTVALQKDQGHAAAAMDLAKRVGARFFMSDPKRKWLQAHQGQELTAQVAEVSASDRTKLTLSGLPSGVVLTNDDHFSISYGLSPVRFYLGKVVAGGTVNGATIEVSVLPFLPLGLTAGMTVTLHSPVCVAKYVPGSLEPIQRLPGYDSGFSFKWRQTKR